MKKTRMSMYPKKVIRERKSKIAMILFIAILLAIATAIAFVIFWDNIVGFMSKSGIIVVIIALSALVSVGSALAIAKVKGHDSDSF